MNSMIYLDYNASTPIDPVVRDAMLPFLGEMHGNPTSSHALGKRMRQAVDDAREQIAALIGSSPDEIIFTSGGTEANNHAIKGVAHTHRKRGKHIITSAVEHPAVRNPCKFLEQLGYEVSYVPVDSTGWIDPQVVAEAVRPDTILISIMHANNEVGTIQDISQIAEIAQQAGALMHTDAAQSVGKIATRVDELGVDFLTIAGHKIYAPQGIGALYVRRGAELEPLLHGAGHEQDRRSGTEAVPAIVGLGVAAELAQRSLPNTRVTLLRDRLYDGLSGALGDDVVLLGHPSRRLSSTCCVGFRGRVGGEILAVCPQICASTGAACHSGKARRSATLTAMNVPEEIAFGAVRFSVGRPTTEDEVDTAVEQIVAAVRQGVAS